MNRQVGDLPRIGGQRPLTRSSNEPAGRRRAAHGWSKTVGLMGVVGVKSSSKMSCFGLIWTRPAGNGRKVGDPDKLVTATAGRRLAAHRWSKTVAEIEQ